MKLYMLEVQILPAAPAIKVIKMIVELAKCPHCGGKFDPGADMCIYCGFGLIYEGNKEEVKKIPQRPMFLIKNGRVRNLAHEREYYGCPVCLKKVYNGHNLCDHQTEPTTLYWRKYVVSEQSEKFVIECTPLVTELVVGTRYKFSGTYYPDDERFVVKEVRELW